MQRSTLLAFVSAGFFTSLAACKPATQGSEVQSFFGLEAAQDAAIRNAGAPLYIMLSDWFQKFKLTAEGKKATGYQPSMEAVRESLPKALHAPLNAYLDQQLQRVDDMREALDEKDATKRRQRLDALLELESKELKDIVLAIVDTQHVLQTEDLFARLIVMSRRGGNDYIDRFASKQFLEPLLKKYSFPTMVNDAERERLVFLEALRKNFLGDSAAEERYRKQVTKTRAAILAMKDSLAGAASLTEAGAGELSGPIAAFTSLLSNGQAYTQRNFGNANNKGLQTSNPAGPAPAPAAPAAPQAAPQAAPTNNTPPNAPFLAGIQNKGDGKMYPPPAGGQSVNNNGGLPPQGGRPPQQNIPQNIPQNGQFPPNQGGFPPGGNQPGFPPQGGGQGIVYDEMGRPYLIDPNGFLQPLGLTNNTAQAPKQLPQPPIDCTKQRLEGFAHVTCGRYAAYANTAPAAAGRFPLVEESAAAGLSLNASDTIEIVQHFVKAGDTGSGGSISNQNPVGSCSLHAAHSAALAQMVGARKDGNMMRKPGSEINQLFQNQQQGQATMEAAVQAIQEIYPSAPWAVKQLQGIENAKASMAAGRAVMMRLEIQVSAWSGYGGGGGGQEFPLTEGEDGVIGEGYALQGGGAIGCSADRSGGHAITAVGYNSAGNFIIQNSWGQQWGFGGLAEVNVNDPNCARGIQFFDFGIQ